MFRWLKEWWYERIIRRSEVTDSEWHYAFQNLTIVHRLSDQEKEKLRRLAILFLHYKSLEGVGDIHITNTQRVIIALQACLPILNLGLNWYDGWVSVIIYPGAYSHEQSDKDEYGVVHQGRENLSGESWERGPVILSWDDIVHRNKTDGNNLIIHELAHKLDMLNGSANGHPPLHTDMSIQQWAKVFNRAYADFNRRIELHDFIPIDHYAATSPAEFFAVFSEFFFENPGIIMEYYPDVYQLLVKFYRQNPMMGFSQ